VAKWVGLFLVLLLCSTWLLTAGWEVGYYSDEMGIGFGTGVFFLCTYSRNSVVVTGSYAIPFPLDLGLRWLYYGHPSGSGFLLVIPFWLLSSALAIPTTFLWWRDRKRFPAGHCQTCGYDLTGNVSGVCPECGKEA
jgi:hypothetical protein